MNGTFQHWKNEYEIPFYENSIRENRPILELMNNLNKNSVLATTNILNLLRFWVFLKTLLLMKLKKDTGN
jgi:hypothetical protein